MDAQQNKQPCTALVNHVCLSPNSSCILLDLIILDSVVQFSHQTIELYGAHRQSTPKRKQARVKSRKMCCEPFPLETHTRQFLECSVSLELDFSSKLYLSMNGLAFSSHNEACLSVCSLLESLCGIRNTVQESRCCARVLLVLCGVQSTYVSYGVTLAGHMLGLQRQKVGLESVTRTLLWKQQDLGKEKKGPLRQGIGMPRPRGGIHRVPENRLPTGPREAIVYQMTGWNHQELTV